MNIQVATGNAEQTHQLARHIGERLRGGEVIELTSDVGGGKTTFVRGLAQGANSNDHVSSPTFTISKVYEAPSFRIVHFDFYRLHESGLMEHEIQEAITDPKVVIVVEWSNVVKHILPKDRLAIRIQKNNENGRIFTLDYPESYGYLVEDISQ